MELIASFDEVFLLVDGNLINIAEITNILTRHRDNVPVENESLIFLRGVERAIRVPRPVREIARVLHTQ